ncbi:MAG: DUF1501 domain-containing protein [Gammaproteobacteria bacterium]|nr:DUF1501 domain-containing protein [Gammaproteobacteria bacterium]NNF49552.1 DUF1501 domain-containing protein [Woeseiaceae bacterium]MBT8093846.1 DUF1501 domain-containing protein [Gammaproteobacteria bacterium]MBT8105811.1 DUF1501 domain-containing protein [Gammaproteobacteria bacterium]NNK25825.1 DUF1501 domain-containing protein [Woeseiaceae bacterium]
MKTLNRRDFLRTSGAAALFAATPGLAYSQVVGGPGPFDDYKALVCVFLFGGNDSYNMLVPNTTAEYNAYAASRQNLALLQGDLLPITPASAAGPDFGLHPGMAGVERLFRDNVAAFVTNVGPLVEPTTRDQYFNKSVTLPPQLFSHNDQQDQWTSLRGNVPSKTGWAGRMADLIRDGVAGQQMATNASLFGSNLFQSADETVAYVMGPGGPIQFQGFSTTPGDLFYEQRLAFERIVNAEYETIYERGFAEVQRRAIAAADTVSAALDLAPDLATVFPASQLGTQLQTVARLIAVRDELQMQRQVFFVASGGFDSHDNQNEDQPGLLGGVSDALAAFYDATAELNVASNVTAFTQSDFGRTLTSNGDGTDHAWGGNQLVVGGAVNGGDLYGSYPALEIDGPEDVGGGRMIPSTSADQYAATLARWFGIPEADLDIVAPNLPNFLQRDLGFMI